VTPLYPRLLGAAWPGVAEPIRFAHRDETTVRARGHLRISYGPGRIARLLARVMRLPRATDAADTRLTVTSRADGEQWLRTFDGRRLHTRQYEAGECVLAERVGLLEFRFRVEPSNGSLLFRQLEAALVVGSLRVRVPGAWAPTVEAREESAGARRTYVHVRVVLPALGPLLTYEGNIDYEESRA
jgi:hypothetical protein